MNRKLITLHSSTNDGLFDCNFNDDIIIKKDSHVSFVSCSLSLDNNKIIIDNNNDGIIFKIGNAPLRTARISHGIYSNDNIGDLIMRIQNSINEQLDINQQDEHGQQCLIDLNDKNKIVIKFAGYPYSNAVDNGSIITQSYRAVGLSAVAPTILQRTAGNSSDTDQFNAFIVGTETNTRGCGGTLVTIDTYVNTNVATNGGFILGWIKGKSNLNDIHKDDLEYYVHCKNKVLAPYEIKTKNGIIIQTSINPRAGDTIGLVVSRGIIFFAMYNPADAAPNYIRIDAFPYDTESHSTTDPFISVLSIFGSDVNTKVKDFKTMFDPHSNFLTENVLTDFVLAGGITSQPPASNGHDDHRYIFNFPSFQIANDLGFDEQDFDSVGESDGLVYIADNTFQNVFHPDNYKIELLNINLESYDSQTQGRRNILGIIPISETFLDQNMSLLQYEVSNILPLSVRNDTTVALRNIRARLINSHNETAITYGLSFINIMVQYL